MDDRDNATVAGPEDLTLNVTSIDPSAFQRMSRGYIMTIGVVGSNVTIQSPNGLNVNRK
jgi:hypothetical protein